MKNDLPTNRLNINLTDEDKQRLLNLRNEYEAKLGFRVKWTELIRYIIHNHNIPSSLSSD